MRVKTFHELTEAEPIIKACEVCHVGMVDKDNHPYTLPMNFGIETDTIYLHSGPEGKKIDILKAHPEVCLSFSTDYKLYHQSENVGCSYGMRYRSVLIFGKVEFVEDEAGKQRILNIIMSHYTGRSDFKYNAPAIRNVRIMRIKIERLEGRTFGY
ncbi:MAG: pyridoxamine 5'-phosphate oxidase family protein [Lentimicrobiaceae bacterium]|nr:pyridoxamine 5'-phosphate oxidase family protein [Lentimicrobiaceae bacterium]